MKVLSISATILVLAAGMNAYAKMDKAQAAKVCSEVAFDLERYNQNIALGVTPEMAQVNARRTVFHHTTFDRLVASGLSFKEAETAAYDWEYTDNSKDCVQYRLVLRGGQ